MSVVNSEIILGINDWVMKFFFMKYREMWLEWFGKRGMNWYFLVVVYLVDYFDCKLI